MVQKKRVHDGPQTLKQAKAAFKARGATAVSSAERRQLERGAILLQRADRIKEQEQRRKELREKKPDVKCAVPAPKLGTQRRLDKFGYKSSQFHLGAFFTKPKIAAPSPQQDESYKSVQNETISLEPWEEDDVDDDTLLDLANESPVLTTKSSANLPVQTTPSKTKTQPAAQHVISSAGEDLSPWNDFLEDSSQLARDLATTEGTSKISSFDRIPSFTSTDFDFSVDDLEELDEPVNNTARQHEDLKQSAPTHTLPKAACTDNSSKTNMQQAYEQEQLPKAKDIDRALMPPPPPPKLPANQSMIMQRAAPPRVDPSYVPHGISLADLENLAGEDIQLSQFDGT